nr:hypothetical protein GCM10017745_18140 [Saccharothrix mutabilis subsp. capreolus]
MRGAVAFLGNPGDDHRRPYPTPFTVGPAGITTPFGDACHIDHVISDVLAELPVNAVSSATREAVVIPIKQKGPATGSASSPSCGKPGWAESSPMTWDWARRSSRSC